MNAPKRKKVGLSQESALDLMQEIYTESVDERNRALQTFKKFMRDTEQNTDIALVGKITNELLKIVDSAIEKKLKLLKIQTDILYKTNKVTDDSEKDFRLTEDMTAQIHKELKEGLEATAEAKNNDLTYE
jgi:ATP-dependent Lon protease